jgi:hypothetical protein
MLLGLQRGFLSFGQFFLVTASLLKMSPAMGMGGLGYGMFISGSLSKSDGILLLQSTVATTPSS